MMVFLDIIVGIVLILWGVWEYKDGIRMFNNSNDVSLNEHQIKIKSVLLMVILVITGVLFILGIFKVEYFI